MVRWYHTISLGKDGLSKYVRLLLMMGEPSTPTFLRDHLANLRSFTQVEHLGFSQLDLGEFTDQELTCFFGHFSTVRSIWIRPSGSPQSLLDFLALFPLLETTVISSPRIRGKLDDSRLHLPNLVCRGGLVLKSCTIDDDRGEDNSSLSCLTRPTMCYRKLALGLVAVFDLPRLERFFETCGGSLESVQFSDSIVCEYRVSPFVILC